MTIIYIVTEGQHSNYHIVGAYSTRENAEAARSSEGGDIEEYIIDEDLDFMRQRMTRYLVSIATGGSDIDYIRPLDHNEREMCQIVSPRLNITTTSDPKVWANGKSLLMIHWAKDEQHAAKIAMEKRAAWVAMEQR